MVESCIEDGNESLLERKQIINVYYIAFCSNVIAIKASRAS